MNNSWTINGLGELDDFAQQLVTQLGNRVSKSQATVVALTGDLGAGKTTLTQHIAKHVGITEPVSSPTFVISKYYDLKKQPWQRLIHIDAYRLDGENLDVMGFDELFADPNNLIVVEWPRYVNQKLPISKIDITISMVSESCRDIVVTF